MQVSLILSQNNIYIYLRVLATFQSQMLMDSWSFFFFFSLVIIGCNGAAIENEVGDFTTSETDIEFYDLQSTSHNAGNTEIGISLPVSGIVVQVPDSSVVFRFENLSQTKSTTITGGVASSKSIISGYTIELSSFESRSTRANSDEDYITTCNDWFLNDAKGELDRIEQLLPPRFYQVKIIDYRADLRFHGKPYSRRIMYYKDEYWRGTVFEDVRGLNFQYVTLHEGLKYTLNLDYYGDGKAASDLIGEFSAIAGTLRFR